MNKFYIIAIIFMTAFHNFSSAMEADILEDAENFNPDEVLNRLLEEEEILHPLLFNAEFWNPVVPAAFHHAPVPHEQAPTRDVPQDQGSLAAEIKDQVFTQLINKIKAPPGRETLISEAIDAVNRLFWMFDTYAAHHANRSVLTKIYKTYAVASVTLIMQRMQGFNKIKAYSFKAQFPFILSNGRFNSVREANHNEVLIYLETHASSVIDYILRCPYINNAYNNLNAFLTSSYNTDYTNFNKMLHATHEGSYRDYFKLLSNYYAHDMFVWNDRPPKGIAALFQERLNPYRLTAQIISIEPPRDAGRDAVFPHDRKRKAPESPRMPTQNIQMRRESQEEQILEARRKMRRVTDTAKVSLDGVLEYTNDAGCKFYGNPDEAEPVNADALARLDEIMLALEGVRAELSDSDFSAAYRVLVLLKELSLTNLEICRDLFWQFANNSAEYIRYSKNRDIVLHANDGLIPIGKRAEASVRALTMAFDLAQKNSVLVSFFRRAFLLPGHNTICLESAQRAQMDWMAEEEHRFHAVQRRTDATPASENEIMDYFQKALEDFKSKFPLEALGGRTYNQAIGDGKNYKLVEAAEKALEDKTILEVIITQMLAETERDKLLTSKEEVIAIITKYSLF